MALALLTGLASAIYWLFGMTFSPAWTFQNHYYIAQVAAGELAAGRYPLWDPGLGAGNLFLEHYGVAPYLLSTPFIRLLGPDGGVRAFMVGLHLLIAAGAYLAATRLLGHGWAAWLASAAYLFSFRVMFDLCLNASFSHALAIGLVGWAFWAYEGHRESGGAPWLLGTIGILALAIATHPQHALKLYLFLALWVMTTRRADWEGRPGAFLGHVTLVFGLPLILVAFKIVEWLSLYPGVPGANSLSMIQEPQPWRTPLTNLFTLPGFVLGFLSQHLLGWSATSVTYLEAEGSDYLGLSVVALAAASAWAVRRETSRFRLRALVAFLGLCGVFYYLLASWPLVQRIPGWGAFISVRDRWVFLASFALAILAGCGAREIAARTGGEGRAWIRPALSMLLLADLAGTSLTLAGGVGTHVDPLDLPLPAEWRRSGLPNPAARTHRVLDLVRAGSDETVAALVPLATRTASATPDWSIILAMPNEYYAFYASLVRDLGEPGREAGLAERLALLNVGTVRIDPSALPQDPVARGAALDRLRRESGLAPHEIAGGTGYFFENPRAVECVVPRAAIAIIGDPMGSEAAFERIARMPGFSVRALLPLLLPAPARLPAEALPQLRGALRTEGGALPAGWTVLSLDAIQRLLAQDRVTIGDGPTCTAARPGHYTVDLRLGPRERAGFVFLSQAYFEQAGYLNPWVADDGEGHALPTMKAGAGLTAVWAPVAVRTIRLRFELPRSRRIGAWVSLVGWAVYGAALLWTLARSSGARPSPAGAEGGP